MATLVNRLVTEENPDATVAFSPSSPMSPAVFCRPIQ